jgi:hypothetical protein
VLIQLECAFTHMNAVSGENLSGVFVPMKFERVSRTTHGRRGRRCHGPSAVLPDDCDMHPGRERPPFPGLRISTGGWQRGSLTPQMSRSLLRTAALTATRAAQSAARYTAAKLLTRKDIDQSI